MGGRDRSAPAVGAEAEEKTDNSSNEGKVFRGNDTGIVEALYDVLLLLLLLLFSEEKPLPFVIEGKDEPAAEAACRGMEGCGRR